MCSIAIAGFLWFVSLSVCWIIHDHNDHLALFVYSFCTCMVWTSRLTVIKRLENTEIETKQRTMPINGIKWGIDRDDKTAQKLPSQSKFGRNHNNSNGSSSSSGQWTFVIPIWGLCAKELPTDHSCLSLELHRYTICVSKNRLGFFLLLFHSETNQTKRNWSLWMGSKWFFFKQFDSILSK